MTNSASSNLISLTGRPGLALLAMLFGVVMPGSVGADTLTGIVTLTDGQGNVTKQYTTSTRITYLLTPATSAGCGSLIRTDLRDTPPTTVSYQFTGSGADGCGPVYLS